MDGLKAKKAGQNRLFRSNDINTAFGSAYFAALAAAVAGAAAGATNFPPAAAVM